MPDDEFNEDDVLDRDGYKEEEVTKKTDWKKEKKGDMTRKEAQNYPKIGKMIKDHPETIDKIASKTGIPKDFLDSVGPDLGNFISKYAFMVLGGKGTALDPAKLKWFEDLKKDLGPTIKALYSYVIKKQAGKMGMTQEDIAKLHEIQSEQGEEAAALYLQERLSESTEHNIQIPSEWESEQGVVAEDDREIPLDPFAEPPKRLMQPGTGGLPSIDELAQRAGVNTQDLEPRGDMFKQTVKPTSTDTDTIKAMMEQEKERVKNGDLYGKRTPEDYNVNTETIDTETVANLELPGATEVMDALNEEALKMKQQIQERINNTKEKEDTIETKDTNSETVTMKIKDIPPELLSAPTDNSDITEAIKQETKTDQSEPLPTQTTEPQPQPDEIPTIDIPEDFPALTKLKRMKRKEVNSWARRIGINPTHFRKANDLIDCITETIEGK